jgi:tetratricopeptide (TPR) repeat protein
MLTRALAVLYLAVTIGPPAPAQSTVHYQGGFSMFKAGKCDQALAELAESERAREPAPERPLYQGICLARQGEWARAFERLDPFTHSFPGNATGWYWLAQVDLYQKHSAEARVAIQRSIALDSTNPDAYRTLGEIELQLKQYDSAYRAWVQANKLNPGDARTTYYIGRLFYEAEFFNEAASWLRETLKLAPNHFQAMTYLGMCAERLDMPEPAARLYRQAIAASKQQQKPYSWAFLNLGKQLRQLGRNQEALAILEEAERLCPEPNALTALGQTLAAAGQQQRAEAVLRRALDMDHELPDAHYRLALLLRASGRAAEAQSEMQAFQQTKSQHERDTVKIQALRRTP